MYNCIQKSTRSLSESKDSESWVEGEIGTDWRDKWDLGEDGPWDGLGSIRSGGREGLGWEPWVKAGGPQSVPRPREASTAEAAGLWGTRAELSGCVRVGVWGCIVNPRGGTQTWSDRTGNSCSLSSSPWKQPERHMRKMSLDVTAFLK